MGNRYRYTIDLDERYEEIFKNLANSKGCSQAELLKRAICTYKVLNDIAKDGQELCICDDDSNILANIRIY